MPQTPVYGFPFEHPVDDEPGHTLDGGSLGTEPILAEAVEAEVSRIDVDLSDALARLDLLEAGTSMVGWTPIQAGSEAGVVSFDIDLTDGGRFSVGEFALVRLHMRFDRSDTGEVVARINNDTGGGTAYYWGHRQLDAANPTDTNLDTHPHTRAALGIDNLEHSAADGEWRIGWGSTVSTNNLECQFFHMDGNNFHSFQSTSARMSSTSATTHGHSEHWGALSTALSAAPSTIRISTGTGASTFVNAWFWLEGYRVPA